MKLRYEVDEEQRLIVSRFVNGLRAYIKLELKLQLPYSLDIAYQKALNYEKYFLVVLRRISFTLDTWLSRLGTFPRSTSNTQIVIPIPPLGFAPSAPFTSLVRKTSPISSSTYPFTSQIECHHYHVKGHIAFRCPQCTLVIETEDDSLLEDTNELLVMDPLELDYEDDPFMMYVDNSLLDKDYHSVMRCILSTSNNSDSWKHTNIFHTFIPFNGKSCKLVIDGGSSMNVISKTIVDRFGLKVEPHPYPFKIA